MADKEKILAGRKAVAVVILTLLLSLMLSGCQAHQEYRLKERQYPPDPEYIVNKRHSGEILPLSYWITPDEVKELASEIAPLESPDRGTLLYQYVAQSGGFEYVFEPKDYWQLPAETIRLKTGDCEDFAFLLHSLLLAAGLDSYLVLGSTASYGSDARILHSWVESEGYVYEATVYYAALLVDSEYYRKTYESELRFKK